LKADKNCQKIFDEIINDKGRSNVDIEYSDDITLHLKKKHIHFKKQFIPNFNTY